MAMQSAQHWVQHFMFQMCCVWWSYYDSCWNQMKHKQEYTALQKTWHIFTEVVCLEKVHVRFYLCLYWPHMTAKWDTEYITCLSPWLSQHFKDAKFDYCPSITMWFWQNMYKICCQVIFVLSFFDLVTGLILLLSEIKGVFITSSTVANNAPRELYQKRSLYEHVF